MSNLAVNYYNSEEGQPHIQNESGETKCWSGRALTWMVEKDCRSPIANAVVAVAAGFAGFFKHTAHAFCNFSAALICGAIYGVPALIYGAVTGHSLNNETLNKIGAYAFDQLVKGGKHVGSALGDGYRVVTLGIPAAIHVQFWPENFQEGVVHDLPAVIKEVIAFPGAPILLFLACVGNSGGGHHHC